MNLKNNSVSQYEMLKKYQFSKREIISICREDSFSEISASLADLKSNSDKDPTNKELRFELAEKYISLNEIESGFNVLLSMYETDPQWNDEAAKSQLFVIFEALEPNNPIVLNGRRKLSSLIFA